MNERYCTLYLGHIFDLLAGERRSEVLSRALRVIELWRSTAHMDSFYARRWSEILAMPAQAARAAVLAQTPEGEMLRHCMPFAGVLDNNQRAMLRRAAKA